MNLHDITEVWTTLETIDLSYWWSTVKSIAILSPPRLGQDIAMSISCMYSTEEADIVVTMGNDFGCYT